MSLVVGKFEVQVIPLLVMLGAATMVRKLERTESQALPSKLSRNAL